MHSMTGFGRGTAASEAWQATIEINAVNRKQAEIVVQAPRELSALEGRIRKSVLAIVSRGRVQVSISMERAQGASPAIRVDAALAKAFHNAFIGLGNSLGQPLVPNVADYLRQPGLIELGSGEIDAEEAWPVIEPALDDALRSLAAMRESEGNHLKSDFLVRLETLRGFTGKIAKDAPARPIRQRDLLAKRLRDAGLDLDPSDERVAKELALFADRCDVSEELTRLDSHFAKFREYLEAAEAPGRALDFLCQELFREFNTIGSKSNDSGITQTIVEAKTELEKIREQVQNVE
ncbi:MAG: YicC family protein [Gloeobacteraceae cyanobacterium ES-bin-144]|nr:YicC family protein [Verrucomicrobiales bacterium]